MSYGLTSAECRETKAGLKASIGEREKVMEDFITISNKIDMNWEARAQAVGSLTMDIRNMKMRLKTMRRKHNGKK